MDKRINYFILSNWLKITFHLLICPKTFEETYEDHVMLALEGHKIAAKV